MVPSGRFSGKLGIVDADSLHPGPLTRRLGQRVEFAEEVDSTNDQAVAALRGGRLPEGTAFVAARQSRGKGTGGNRWYSSDDQGLWTSIILQEPVRHHPLSFLPCIALVDVLRDGFGIAAHLKWPNDVLVGDRKLAGCLVESQQQPDGGTAWVLGLGVNVNQTCFEPPIADIAVSMRMVTGATHRRSELFRALVARMEELYDDERSLVERWRELTEMLGRRVRLRRDGRSVLVTALDLTAEGHLQVLREDGEREEWLARVEFEVE